jgi:GDP-L-fucose synthase
MPESGARGVIMAARVLLTGGSGFFGRRIAEALRRHGHDVSTPGRPDFDLMDPGATLRTVERLRPETIVHSAAYYGGLGICMAEPARIFHRNVQMGLNLLAAAAQTGVRRMMAIGSACSYPGGVAGDMKEEDFWSGPLHPSVEAYGFTKKVLEVGLRAYGREHGLASQMPIITNLYGEHDVFGEYRSHVAAALIKKFADAVRSRADQVICWGTGAPVREFIYSGDAAEAVARLLASGYAEPLNIGTGIGTSIKELAELVARLTGFRGEIVWDTSKADGVLRKVLDVSRMESILSWRPPTSLEAGLQRTIRWYLENKAEADSRP